MRWLSLVSVSAALLLATSVALAQEKGKWVSISDGVTSQVKPGYPGKTAGVTVDPSNGDVFMVVPDQGMWKSTDRGATFARVDDKAIGGRCETGYALNFDPAGKRLMCFMIYGSSAVTTDGGKTWSKSKVSHLDVGAVDWEATGQSFLSFRHESGGMLTFSTDAGQNWKDLGKGFKETVGVFDAKTLMASKGTGLLRSTDAGETWTQVHDTRPTGCVMSVKGGVGYWPTEKGLLVSKDKGATWAIQGKAVSANFGPFWGKEAKHMVVVGKGGIHETTDAGETWTVVAPLPPGIGVGLVGPNYAWDPVNNVFYSSAMGKETFRYER
jgi:photosystem II stability/assembly factor-like uncharacterized protein